MPGGRRDRRVDSPPEILARHTVAGPACPEVWGGALIPGGYGQITLANSHGKQFTIRVHRLALILATGIDPPDLWALHTCPDGDNRACITPSHLRWGTPRNNAADRDSRGRAADTSGERNSMAKLSDAQRAEIRESTDQRKVLAARYGITLRHVYKIRAAR